MTRQGLGKASIQCIRCFEEEVGQAEAEVCGSTTRIIL